MRFDDIVVSSVRLAHLARSGRSTRRNAQPLHDEPLFEELESRQMMTGDIAVTGVSLLPGMTVFEGASVTASVNYRNAGTFLTDPATLRIILSDNSTYGDADDILIFNGANGAIGGLAIGASQHVTTSPFVLPPMARAGSYYVIANMTPGGVDASAANNTFYSLTRFVVNGPPPSVELSNTTTVTGGTFQPGQTVTGTVTARNNGTLAIGEGAWVRFALSVDSIWGNEDDIAVTSPTGQTFETLPAGSNSTVPISFVVAGGTPNGPYRLLSMIDWDRDFPETNEANNAYAQPLANIIVARPDLQGTMTAPATIAAGTLISPAFTIRNAGGAASGFAHFTIALRPLNAPNASTDIPVLGNGYIPPLAAGASSTMATGSFAIGATAPAGQYRVVLLLDILTEVPEGNEANNTIVASTITTVTNTGAATLPDLLASVLPLTRTVLPGDALDPFIRVSNLDAVGGVPFGIRMFLSSNATLDASDIQIGGFTAPVAPLTIQFQPGALVPTWMPGGVYYLIAQADSEAAVTESNETNNTAATATASITVVRPVVSISASDPAAAEVNAPGTPNIGVFTITRTGPTTAPLVVNFTLGGTAAEGSDFATIPHLVTIPAGATSATFTINVVNDNAGEPIETVIATLARGTGYSINLATNRATVNIADNEALVTVVATDPLATESTAPAAADGGRFTFTRTGPTTNPLTVTYTLGGTASGMDYSGAVGNVTFAAGSATATVNIASLDDAIGEPAETAILTVLAGLGYAPGAAASATVTINDNEPVVTVTASDPAAAQTRQGETLNPGQFRLTRTGPTTTPLEVFYNFGGTALPGLDYLDADTHITLSGHITIPAGQSSVVLNIAPQVVPHAGAITATITPIFGSFQLYRTAVPAVPATVTITPLPPVNLSATGFEQEPESISLSAPHQHNEFHYSLNRTGLPGALAAFTVQLRLSLNDIIGDADDLVVFTRPYAANFTGSQFFEDEIFWDTIPQGPPGTYRLGLFIDSGGLISEFNEADNRVLSTTPVIFTP